jgi:cytosine/uracil/thiamine/allantoin permease
MQGDAGMLGFEPDIWDYLTFLTLLLVVVACVAFWIWLAGLPGRIAIARKHPEAEAVKLLGWAGLLPTIYPWIQAFIWAYKPTNIIDIRRYPREEAQWIEAEIARLRGDPPKVSTEADRSSKGTNESSPAPAPDPAEDRPK